MIDPIRGRSVASQQVTVYVHPGPSQDFAAGFDVAQTIDALQLAEKLIRQGDGSGATTACAEALARLALFHR